MSIFDDNLLNTYVEGCLSALQKQFDEQIGKYFDENGIKTVDKASISDL